MQVSVLKITNRDDINEDDMFFTIKRLRETVLNDWYDCWVDNESEDNITKEEIATDDEKLFDFMDEWGYNVEFIITITEQDLIN